MLGDRSTNLEVRVDGKVDPYEAALRRADRATLRTERQLALLDKQIQKVEREFNDNLTRRVDARNQAFATTGRVMVGAGIAALAAAGYAVNAAMKWETAWTGVTKTVNATPAQFNMLEGQLRSMARSLPASHEEIAGVAEAAGQLGVKTKDIASFTKTMIDMGISTNLSSEEAATSLAQFMNVMGTASGDVNRLASTIVSLGNSGASTEADITHMAQRLTGAAKVVGATDQGVLALASSMANLGIQSELGGGAMSRVLLIIDGALRDGGDKAEALARIAGVSASDFARAWEADPVKAMDLFAQGMGRAQANNENLTAALQDAGIKGTQNLQVILRLAGAHDEIGRNIRLANKAWDDNSALVNEANKRYQTTASRLQVAKNQINDTAISIGQGLLPMLGKAADFFGNVAAAMGQLPGPVKALIGPMTALVGIVALVGGAMLLAIPKIAAFNAALASGNLGGGMQRTGNAVRGLAGFLTGGWGIALGVGISALTVFAAKQGAAARQVDALKATLDDQTGALSQNSRQWAIKTLSDKGALDAASALGLNLAEVTNAALGNDQALAQVQARIDELTSQNQFSGRSRGVSADTAKTIQQLKVVQDTLGSTNGTLTDARKKWQLEHEAMGSAGDAADKTSDSSKKAGAAQQVLGDGAGDATQTLQAEKTAAEELSDALEQLNGVILGARAGARDYQQTLDEANKTLKQGKRTLDINTKAGRDNQAALDSIADSTMKWSDSLKDVDSTGRRSWKVLQQGREDLYKTARSFGMSREEAHKYVNQVLDIPEDWKTQFLVDKRKATQDTHDWRREIDEIPKDHLTTAKFDGRKAAADAAAAARSIVRSLEGIPDEPVNIKLSAQAAKVQAQLGKINFAEGGPVKGAGSGTSDSILARLSNGEHVITAEEVRKAGGHQMIEAFRRAALRGELPRNGQIPRSGDLQPFKDGGPVLINPDVRTLGVMSAVGAVNSLVRAIARSESSRLSHAASKALTAAPRGSLGIAGHLTPGQVVRGQQFAQRQVGKPYIWGGVGPGGYDCSGAVSAVTNAALGRFPYQRLGSTGTMPWPGWQMGVGRLTAGWFSGSPGHTAGRLGGLGFESAGGVGFRTGGSARSPMSFPRQMHLRDGGGRLPHGDAALNLSGDEEAVITGPQVRALRAAARELGQASRSGGSSVSVEFPKVLRLRVGDREFDAYVDQRAAGVARRESDADRRFDRAMGSRR
jgi:TP901 family phage tail tape measure protein